MPPLAELFLSSFLVGFSGAVMPGPMFTACIGESLRQGFRAGPRIVLGHGIVEVALVALLAFGLAPLLTHPGLLRGIGIVGGALMIWMGVDLVRHSRAVAASALAGTSGGGGAGAAIRAGMFTSLGNPYFYIWWSTIGLAFILRGRDVGWAGLPVFYGGHILSDIAWYFAVAFAVSHGRRVAPPGVFRWVLVLCGVALAGFGILFMTGR